MCSCLAAALSALSLFAAVVAPPALSQHHSHDKPPTAPVKPARAIKPGPAVLQNISRAPNTVEVSLTATPARLSIAPNTVTDAYAYNGRIPGPTLEVREGDRVIVHFTNLLPVATTVHWHGVHLPFISDGSPLHPVAPGDKREYVFTVRPGTAGTYWYHPHPHHSTGYQVGKGLYGAMIVRAPNDPLEGIPEKLIVLSDNRILPDGSLDTPDPHSIPGRIDRENGREGSLLLANGRVMPTLTIRSGEVQRWRVINASAARVYRLSLAGHTFLHVGTDGGLFEKPVEVKEILVAGAERVELLVRGTGKPGEQFTLQTLPYDRYIPQTRPKDWSGARDVLTLKYSADPPLAARAIPATLRPIPVLDTASATATRVMVLTQGLINGQMMDTMRVDVSTSLGATEIWQVENLVGMDHPFHLHGFQFQVIDRDGVPEPFRAWKDVVNVPKHSMARFIVRYDNYPGKWMFHCHILDHEDHGMMGILEVK
ncbi:MAG TPA: multicopper oxidase family protein [Gemmatimonadaceae bacterium]|nr:multicopper oxidase family protein [Gemmatimonadaceae bacterium]